MSETLQMNERLTLKIVERARHSSSRDGLGGGGLPSPSGRKRRLRSPWHLAEAIILAEELHRKSRRRDPGDLERDSPEREWIFTTKVKVGFDEDWRLGVRKTLALCQGGRAPAQEAEYAWQRAAPSRAGSGQVPKNFLLVTQVRFAARYFFSRTPLPGDGDFTPCPATLRTPEAPTREAFLFLAPDPGNWWPRKMNASVSANLTPSQVRKNSSFTAPELAMQIASRQPGDEAEVGGIDVHDGAVRRIGHIGSG
jgi:hypothetical protein